MLLRECPHCGSADCRVIGGPGTKGGPQFWAGCDHCNGRAWGDTQADAVAAWNRRPLPSEGRRLEEAHDLLKRVWEWLWWTDVEEVAGLRDEIAMWLNASPLSSKPEGRRLGLEEAAKVADTMGVAAIRIGTRVEAILERDGSVEAAITGRGVGIGYLLAKELHFALERGEAAIRSLIDRKE